MTKKSGKSAEFRGEFHCLGKVTVTGKVRASMASMYGTDRRSRSTSKVETRERL